MFNSVILSPLLVVRIPTNALNIWWNSWDFLVNARNPGLEIVLGVAEWVRVMGCRAGYRVAGGSSQWKAASLES